ncbi:tripartite tricarboxylate transporter substrate binding protein [Variovorax paradoxus]|uniref:Tripartite tricarboxylate transporter family receptor n=1 Tax=Variovorax paradoxus TaxID=34073 RepID=A0A0H2M945_VARPD|nr:tripartite tricarboxylate transporter substrate binding protein [Variovorax paradoxus]KLN53535.1 tripartite tricarboxylate transporter family receptor [Variovorax paradoxus]
MSTGHLSKSSFAVHLTRRTAAAAVFGILAAAAAVQAQTTAQSYPNRPIRLIVGFPPGGSSDATARLLGSALSARLGQPVVVENKAGANTVIATQYLRSQPADGYTLLSVSSSFAINPALQKLTYNIDTDFAPVALLGIIPLMLVTPNEVRAKSLPELIALAKAQPGKLPYASYGAGSAGHIASELLLSMTGAEMIHVPYKGTGPALVDVMGNQVTMMMPTVAASNVLVKEGKLKAIAVSSSKRVSVVPHIPTIAESGLPGYELVAWETIQAAAGTPPEIVNKLNTTIRQILATPEFRDKLIALGIEPDSGKTPAEVGNFVRAEAEKFAKVIKDRGIKPE